MRLSPICLFLAAAAAVGIAIADLHWAWLLIAVAVGWVGGVARHIDRIEGAKEAGEDRLYVSYMNGQLIAAIASVGLFYGVTRGVVWAVS